MGLFHHSPNKMYGHWTKQWRFVLPFLLILFFLSLLSTKTRRAPWYEQWTWNTVSPVVWLFSSFHHNAKSFWNHYLYLVQVSRENEALKKELLAIKQRQITFVELQKENERFLRLLELKESPLPESLPARISAFDPRSEFKTVRIDKGFADGILSDMPVVMPGGLVGKIGPVFKQDAIVLLMVDPASFVDVFVERSHLRGLLQGSGLLRHAELQHGIFLSHLEFLKRESDIQVGDTIVTSGLDSLYPEGIAVGKVVSIQKDSAGLFFKADVLPAIDFGNLREVLVLKTK